MAISKIVYKESSNATPITWMDATIATATASDISAPKTAMLADGVVTTGTGTGGGGASVTIEQLPGGGEHYIISGDGGDANPTAEEKDVNFIDYDGTIRYSYTAAEAQALTELPSNPSHDGLTAQGWNWTLAQIKAQLTNVGGKVWVGQMYVTQSGDTEIDVSFEEELRLSPYLALAVNGTVTVDWGDNSTSTVTGSSLTTRITTQHNYQSAGDYTIKIHVVSGSFAFYGTARTTLVLGRNSTVESENQTYSNRINAVRIGNNAIIGNYAFSYCYSLGYITMPSGIASIGDRAFINAESLSSLTIPRSVTDIGAYAASASRIKKISVPIGVTIRDHALYSCHVIHSVTIPYGTTSTDVQFFYNCYLLTDIKLPSSITSIGNYTFATCHSLASLTIPSAVTSIGTYAFYLTSGMAEIHMLPTTPPTLASTNAFQNIPTDCIIYVPYSSDHSILNAYQTATNWSTYASYMQEEPQS